MKYLFSLKVFLIACMSVLIGGSNVIAQTTVTFVAGTDKSSEKTISKDYVTITITGGTLEREDNYRCYKNHTMTVTSELFQIERIILTCDEDGGPDGFSGDSYTHSDLIGTWEGLANEVQLTASVKVHMTKIEVVLVASDLTITKTSFGDAYDGQTIDVEEGQVNVVFPKATLEPVAAGSLEYSSDNESVAIVDRTSGDITLQGEYGIATITASFVGNDNYTPSSATYSINVKAPAGTKINGYYYQVTSTDELVSGARYLIGAKTEEAGKVILMGKQNTNNRGQIQTLKVASDDNAVLAGLEDGAVELILGKAGNVWTFYDSLCPGYLCAASSSSNNLKTKETLDSNGKATIAIDGNANATIKFQGNYTNNWLRYNSSSSLFSCYKSGQKDIQLYKLYTVNQGEFAIGADGYTTYYTDKAFVMPEGVEGGIVTATAEDGKLTIDYRYVGGSVVPAKTALLLKGATGKYAYGMTTSEDAAPADNLLHGADAVDADGKTFVAGTDVKYYILSKNKEGNKIGFYWAAENGAPVQYQGNKAFLAVDYASGAKHFTMFSLDGDDTTGIEIVNTGAVSHGRIYTLQGVCVGNNADILPKGVYIVGGKKIIVR